MHGKAVVQSPHELPVPTVTAKEAADADAALTDLAASDEMMHVTREPAADAAPAGVSPRAVCAVRCATPPPLPCRP